jgi:hypothetical protein
VHSVAGGLWLTFHSNSGHDGGRGRQLFTDRGGYSESRRSSGGIGWGFKARRLECVRNEGYDDVEVLIVAAYAAAGEEVCGRPNDAPPWR